MTERADASSATEPAYRVVAGELRDLILNKFWEAGVRVPSTRELEAKYNIANMTARKALNLLASEGLIHSIPGKGYIVTERDNVWFERQAEREEAEAQQAEPEAAPDQRSSLNSQEFDTLNARIDELSERVNRLLGFFESFVKAASEAPPASGRGRSQG